MTKFQNIICTRLARQSSTPHLKYIKRFCNQEAKCELKPRFAIKLSPDVLDDIHAKKYKAKSHPGAISHLSRNIKLPDQIAKAIAHQQEESGYTSQILFKDAKILINQIWQRQYSYESNELDDALEKVSRRLIKKGKIPADFFIGSGPKGINDLTSATRKVLIQDLLKHVYRWAPFHFTDYMSFVYLWARAAPDYAALVRVLREIQIRKKDFQPTTVFDFGSGVGTVTWAVDTVWPNKCLEVYNVDSSSSMNTLAHKLLRYNVDPNTDVVRPHRTFYRQFLPASDSLKFDLVVSSRSLFEVGLLKNRARVVDILWRKVNPGGFLVLVEAGTKYGFSLLLEMRDYLLKISEVHRKRFSLKSPIHVFAPCQHDLPCPRFDKDSNTPCYFGVSYEHPTCIKPIIAKKNDLFSYIILQKEDRSDSNKWPRIVEPLLRKHKHTILRVCSSEGSLREFIVTKHQQGSACYHVCKNCRWGDLLPTVEIGSGSNNQELGDSEILSSNSDFFEEDLPTSDKEPLP